MKAHGKRSRMVLVGRVLSMVVLISVMIGFALAGIDSGRLLQDRGLLLLFNVLGALTPLCLLIAGALALYHWGTRVSEPSRRWRIFWGLAIVFGFFIGTAAYWWIGTRYLPAE